jgi:hypothetical protein
MQPWSVVCGLKPQLVITGFGPCGLKPPAVTAVAGDGDRWWWDVELGPLAHWPLSITHSTRSHRHGYEARDPRDGP